MRTEPGLRERKKRERGDHIAETAMRLFIESGFEKVTVASVARAADVSEATVFNHFPTKEDLVFGRLETFESALVDAVRTRRAGESVAGAFSGFLTEQRGLLAQATPEAAERLAAIARVIEGSPALSARERAMFDHYTDVLAELIAAESGGRDDVTAWVVANALIGVHRALVAYVRRQILAGRSGPGLRRSVRTRARHALETLERGLADRPAP